MLAALAAVFLCAGHARAEDTPSLAGNGNETPEPAVRLEEVEVSAPRTSALSAALTDSPLAATQPQSVITLDYIANNVAATADYATIANIAPGVANIETNGPGLSESKHLTMRGFDDAQYNVTYDGIPFGDINDFSHHTTSYFPAKLIGRIDVDRGPGTASTIGEATFGGTIAMFSKDPRRTASFIPTLSYGSWNTQLGHFEFNTGLLPSLNNASAIASYQRMSTDGYRTNSDMKRDTYYFKYLQPVGKETTLTFLSTYNRIHFSNPGTLTQAKIDQLGRNYGLGNNPTQTDDRIYNYQDKQADFEYLGINSHLADGWNVEDKLYTYYYNNESHEKPKTKTVSGVTNILGRFKVNRYRTYGNYLLLSDHTNTGTFKVGAWYEYARNPRYLNSLNYTTLGWTTLDTSSATTQWKAVNGDPSTIGVDYKMVNWLKTLQPFAEYEWEPTKDLTIEPGVKYVNFTRDIEAPVNQTGGREPLYYSQTNSQTVPYLSANYRIDSSMSAYAQVAEGFLAPNLNQFYVANPSVNNVKPEETINYQVGTVYKTERFNADVDAYYIDFSNYAYSGPNDANGDPLYWGVARGAHYYGGETELTYAFGNGFSAYLNGSIIRAKFKGSDLDVPTVPESTAALGLNYSVDGFFASFAEKYVGSWVAYDNLTNPDIAGGGAARRADSAAYALGDVSIGYGLKLGQCFLHTLKVRLQVSNVFDRKVQVLESIDSNPANAYAKDTYNVLPTRNYFLTVSAEF
ncbi:MAG TPA: TonB-dependent receptor [Opitutaceae bacterium]|nr:TonB-dependent receptor [Opitutaceae bacterium]